MYLSFGLKANVFSLDSIMSKMIKNTLKTSKRQNVSSTKFIDIILLYINCYGMS